METVELANIGKAIRRELEFRRDYVLRFGVHKKTAGGLQRPR